MLRRKIYDELLAWKKSHSNTCLMVKGARQVGKTYIIRAFGEKEYRSFIEINFISQKKLKSIFAGSLDAESVYKRMTAQIRGIEPPFREAFDKRKKVEKCIISVLI